MFVSRSRWLTTHFAPLQIRFVHQYRPNTQYTPRDKRKQEDIPIEFQRERIARHPFKHMYPWKTLSEFTDHLEENIIYNDGKLIAINKPWGVGIHKTNTVITEKTNYRTFSEDFGDPKFCVSNALDLLCERLLIQRLRFAKTVDRYQSGVMLLAADDKTLATVKAIGPRMKARKEPHMTFWCICKGFPLEQSYEERVGVEMIEIDELGDYKEPEISISLGKNKRVRQEQIPATVRVETLDINKHLSTSLLEIQSTITKWSFIQVYAAQKTTFILGDVRFSKRVRQLLGVPLLLSPRNINAYDTFEPLATRVRNRLDVGRNSNIPLLLHARKLVIPKYNGKDLELVCDPPEYFGWALNRLDLLPDRRKFKDN